MLNSENLELLTTIIEKGSFSAAARSMGRSPSAVSMGIAGLEAELDIKLFDRRKREPVPTAELLALLPEAKLIVDRLRALRAHAESLSYGSETRLSIGIGADIRRDPILKAVKVVAEAFPHLQIDVVVGPQDEIICALRNGQIDFCVAYSGIDLHRDEHIHHLWTETLVAAACPTHPLIADAAPDQTIEALLDYRQIIVAGLLNPSADPRPIVSHLVWRSSDLSIAISLVRDGQGWANIPEAEILRSGGTLVPISFANIRNGLVIPVYLRRRKMPQGGPAAIRFEEALKDNIGD